MWDLGSAAKARNHSSASETTTESSYMPPTPLSSAPSPWDYKMDVASMCTPGAQSIATSEPAEAATGEMLFLDPYGAQLLDWDDLGLDAELESALSFESPEPPSLQVQITPQLASNEWSRPSNLTPRQTTFSESASGKPSLEQVSETIMSWDLPKVSALPSMIDSKCGSEVARNLFGTSAAGLPYLQIPAPPESAMADGVSSLFDDSFDCWQPNASALDIVLHQWSTQGAPQDAEMSDLPEQRLSEQNLFVFTNNAIAA